MKRKPWRDRWHDIIFEAETPAGKLFDVLLLILILVSVLAVMLDSVASLHLQYGDILIGTEWVLTVLFTLEYLARIMTSKAPRRYIGSFFGIIDLLAILPTYVSFILVGSQYLVIVRILRLLRVFRILKLMRFVGASQALALSLKASRFKILVFLGAVCLIVTIMGSIMYLVEGPENGYANIPLSIYWSIVTLTTVGYGDIAPQTTLGQAIASLIMIMGYAIIAVPTGIITVEMTRQDTRHKVQKACHNCGKEDHLDGAKYCANCGSTL